MSAVLRVLSGGIQTTVQDLGRSHYQRYGVPVGGAMDRFALAAANRLVGNAAGAAALEITAGGAAFEVLNPTRLAFAGVDLGIQIDGQPCSPWLSFYVRSGTAIEVTGRRTAWGARTYLAVAGGFDVPQVLGSRSTYLPGGFGGFEGRSLRAGDLLTANVVDACSALLAGRFWAEAARPSYQAEPALRILPGPHLDTFAPGTLELLSSQQWVVGGSSNRIGYRLEGCRLQLTGAGDVASLGMVPGAIQVPPDGVPILLMADAQPTGGYPLVAVVITPDLPLAAQLLPGDSLRFEVTTQEHARAAWQTMHDWYTVGMQPDETIAYLAWAGA